MAFSRPTLTQIKDRIESDIKNGLSLTTLLTRSFLKVIAATLAGASHTIHGHIQDFAQKQLFPDTADDEYLLRHGANFGVNRLSAVYAEINVTLTGTNGTAVPINTLFQRSDGFEYKLKIGVVISGSTAAVLVALLSGDQGNIDNGSTVNLTSPISGVNSIATVVSTAIEGENEETIEAFRTRLLERMQNPPAGGTVADYIAFAKSVVGVTRVWVLPAHLGQGTVGVTFVEDDEDPIIPDAPKVVEVQAAIDEKQPVTADAFVFAPTATPLNPTIQVTPNNAEVQAAITAELEDLIFREAQVRGAVDPAQVAAAVVFDGKIALSKINEAISIASGENDHVLVLPATTPQPPVGGILTLGTITFQNLV